MPRTTHLMDRLNRVERYVLRRLDRLDNVVEEGAEQLPLGEYLRRAWEYAGRDPQFAARLTQALREYDALRRATNTAQEVGVGPDR